MPFHLILLPTAIYMALLLVGSMLPDNIDQNPGLPLYVTPTIQNFLHIPAYTLITVLWQITLTRSGMAYVQSLFWAAIVAGLYGAALEFGQIWVPGRVACLGDLLLNFAGIGLATFCYCPNGLLPVNRVFTPWPK